MSVTRKFNGLPRIITCSIPDFDPALVSGYDPRSTRLPLKSILNPRRKFENSEGRGCEVRQGDLVRCGRGMRARAGHGTSRIVEGQGGVEVSCGPEEAAFSKRAGGGAPPAEPEGDGKGKKKRQAYRTTPWGRGMRTREVLLLCGAILLGRAEPSRSDAPRSSPQPHRCPTSPSARTKCRQQHARLDVTLGGPEFLKRHSSEMLDPGLDSQAYTPFTNTSYALPSSPLAATLKQVLGSPARSSRAGDPTGRESQAATLKQVQPREGNETALLQYAPLLLLSSSSSSLLSSQVLAGPWALS